MFQNSLLVHTTFNVFILFCITASMAVVLHLHDAVINVAINPSRFWQFIRATVFLAFIDLLWHLILTHFFSADSLIGKTVPTLKPYGLQIYAGMLARATYVSSYVVVVGLIQYEDKYKLLKIITAAALWTTFTLAFIITDNDRSMDWIFIFSVWLCVGASCNFMSIRFMRFFRGLRSKNTPTTQETR